MRYFKLTIAYDGTDYAGWQVQPGQPTIQAALETAILSVTGESIRAVASGRTDAGVHALAQVVSIASATQLPADVLCRALDANTPRDIAVLEVHEAPAGFHAIRDAIGKRYRYLIVDHPQRDVIARRYAWQVHSRLDVDLLRRAAAPLVGKHDFSSFEAAGAERATSVRTVREILLERHAGWTAPQTRH